MQNDEFMKMVEYFTNIAEAGQRKPVYSKQVSLFFIGLRMFLNPWQIRRMFASVSGAFPSSIIDIAENFNPIFSANFPLRFSLFRTILFLENRGSIYLW